MRIGSVRVYVYVYETDAVLTLRSPMVLGSFAVVAQAQNAVLPCHARGKEGRFSLGPRRFRLIQLSPALLLRASASFDSEQNKRAELVLP